MAAQRRRGEEGTLLVIIMIGVAIGSIALTVATQSWSTMLRRDREQELIFRGNQYVTAILAYRKEHGGQFPLNLEDLYKEGPRRLRYIRKLYRDPIARDGKWGLLYLMPGGQGVYDPKAAQKAQEKAKHGWSAIGGMEETGGPPPGVTPLGRGAMPVGLPVDAGTVVGGVPSGMLVFPNLPPPGALGDNPLDAERVSEPPIGWPIIGVISRASGKVSENTFKIYKGHEEVNEWQFHVFDRGEVPQAPPSPAGPIPPRFIGPGRGGTGPILGIGEYGPRPGGMRPMFPRQPGGGRVFDPRGGQQYPPPGSDPNQGGQNRP